MAQFEESTVDLETRSDFPGSKSSSRSSLPRAAALARRNKLGAVGVLLMLSIVLVAILSPVLQRYDEDRAFDTINPDFNPSATASEIARNPGIGSASVLNRWEGPSSSHWFGTDRFGRDIYARIMVGARLAVVIGVGASLISVLGGTVTGLISGYFGGKVDLVLQRFVDTVQAFPGLVLLMLIVSVSERPPLWLMIAALGFLGWAAATRVVRSAVLSVAASTYVEAARVCGAHDIRLMMQHVLPNVIAPIIVIFSINIGVFILAEASLSFLGLGPADQTTWGKMLQTGRNWVDQHPEEALFSGGAITLAVLAFNLAGDGLRDELDPRLRGR